MEWIPIKIKTRLGQDYKAQIGSISVRCLWNTTSLIKSKARNIILWPNLHSNWWIWQSLTNEGNELVLDKFQYLPNTWKMQRVIQYPMMSCGLASATEYFNTYCRPSNVLIGLVATPSRQTGWRSSGPVPSYSSSNSSWTGRSHCSCCKKCKAYWLIWWFKKTRKHRVADSS